MTSSGTDGSLRPYRAGDLGHLYDVCIRTGDSGDDATGKLAQPELLGDIFVGPYYYPHRQDQSF